MGGRMGGWRDGWMDGCMSGWMSGWVDIWMDGWMDGRMCGWMDEWMEGWMNRSIEQVWNSATPECLWAHWPYSALCTSARFCRHARCSEPDLTAPARSVGLAAAPVTTNTSNLHVTWCSTSFPGFPLGGWEWGCVMCITAVTCAERVLSVYDFASWKLYVPMTVYVYLLYNSLSNVRIQHGNVQIIP